MLAPRTWPDAEIGNIRRTRGRGGGGGGHINALLYAVRPRPQPGTGGHHRVLRVRIINNDVF